MADSTSKSWFAVFNNPEEHGYKGTPEEICEQLKSEWVTGSDTRAGAWIYCISADGLHHVHMVLEDAKTMRFSAIKGAYAKGMHFEATKGNKKQVEDYINKRGSFEEKGEKIICSVTHGDIKGRQGRRTDLTRFSEMISEGLTLSEIFESDPNALRYKALLKELYIMKKEKDTPIIRDVNVYWHTGETGSGKSFSYVEKCNELGRDNVFLVSTYNSGAFDNYAGQSCIFIDDYRGQWEYSQFLRLLDVYCQEIPARYTNAKALWNEVHITSVLTPMGCYPDKANSQDSIKQLLRRITAVIYHFKTDLGYYSQIHNPYETYYAMQKLAEFTVKRDKEDSEFINSFKPLEEILDETD